MSYFELIQNDSTFKNQNTIAKHSIDWDSWSPNLLIIINGTLSDPRLKFNKARSTEKFHLLLWVL